MSCWSVFRSGLWFRLLWLSCGVGIAAAEPLSLVGRFGESLREVWQEPVLTIAVGVLPSCFALDRGIAELWHPSPVGDRVFGLARLYGERWTPVVVATGLFLAGWGTGSERLRRAGLAVGGAAVVAAVAGGVLKVGVGRARPSLHEGTWVFRSPGWRNSYQSFPSGHTAIAFAISAALVESCALPPEGAASLYAVAALTGVSRLYHGQHWFSDVVAGAILGYTAGKAVGRLVRGMSERAAVEVSPTLAGVSLRLRWN